jgi:hypothetical protein
MKATKGKANPKILTEIIKEKITGLKWIWYIMRP